MSFVIEQADGYASTGREPILDIQPEELHQRTLLFIGNRALVGKAEEFIATYDGPAEWKKVQKKPLQDCRTCRGFFVQPKNSIV